MISTPKNQRNLHLLVVDDDEMMQSLLAAYLEQEGYDITAVISGKNMFAVLNKRPVDMILLDLTLPTMRTPSTRRHPARPV